MRDEGSGVDEDFPRISITRVKVGFISHLFPYSIFVKEEKKIYDHF